MTENDGWLVIRKELALAFGKDVPGGFLVRAGSTAMCNGSPKEKRNRPERDQLVASGILVQDINPALFRFAVDHKFSSKSAAAGVVIDGNSSVGVWKDTHADDGKSPDRASRQLTRGVIERAMDAYDQYRATGAHSDVFAGFDDPAKYWVRSSRKRVDRKYPTKAITGFLLQKPATALTAGWSQSHDAAARLHAAGYVIVNENDQPLPLPEQYDHLMRGAERVRLVALNYFIEPARERSDPQVSVRVGDVSELLFPKDHYRNVWQALRGKAFQDLANVPEPTQTGADESPATVLTYQLTPLTGESRMTSDHFDQTPATNMILYGPPGTGKTYHTAWEAVRLCLGDTEATPYLGNEKRNELMAEYRRLVDSGRIEFVTFHQSMSYEEFVEGLRPKTAQSLDPEAPQDDEISTGFRLAHEDGVFKRISERAANDRGDAGAGGLVRTRRIYRLRLTGEDWRGDLQRAIGEKEIAWRFGGDTDWSAPEYEDWEAIKQRRRVDDASVKGNHATVYGTWLVRAGAATGAYVMLTVGRDKVVAFGRFTGEYKFTPSSEGEGARHTRPVEWLWSDPAGFDRSVFYQIPFTPLHPIYPLERDRIDWQALESAVLGAEVKPANPRPHVLIIDEVNRANISKVFGELITLLEPDKRLGMANEIRLTLPYSKNRFGVPPNLHIIATMNTADRSIALLDTALRRRFTFRELMPDPSVLPANVEGINLQTLLRTINERIEYLFDREHQIGHAYFCSCKSRDDVDDVMRYKVIPLLAEYFYEDWSKVAAVLGDTEQDRPRFLVRETIAPPKSFEKGTYSGDRFRWRVRSERDGAGNGGFDYSELGA